MLVIRSIDAGTSAMGKNPAERGDDDRVFLGRFRMLHVRFSFLAGIPRSSVVGLQVSNVGTHPAIR